MTSDIERSNRIIPWLIVLFFVVIALVDGIMVTLAVKTHTGLVTDHPYERGLAYNDVLAADALQQSTGWHSDIHYDGSLHFTLYDKAGNVITPALATAHITRPTQDGMDFTVNLKHGKADMHFPLNGLWKIRINAEHDGIYYQKAKRIVIE